jgi:hypothetical protein
VPARRSDGRLCWKRKTSCLIAGGRQGWVRAGDRSPAALPDTVPDDRENTMPATTGRRRRRDTPPPRTGSGEAEVLRGFLDYLRTSIAAKVEDAPEPRVRAAAVPSGTNLLGLLNHLTFVERALFLGDDVPDWQATFSAAPADGVAEVVARYRDAVARANRVLDGCTDLAAPVPRPRPGRPAPSVRWALAHMIEETGRHAGHADIIRELVDGATGR